MVNVVQYLYDAPLFDAALFLNLWIERGFHFQSLDFRSCEQRFQSCHRILEQIRFHLLTKELLPNYGLYKLFASPNICSKFVKFFLSVSSKVTDNLNENQHEYSILCNDTVLKQRWNPQSNSKHYHFLSMISLFPYFMDCNQYKQLLLLIQR